MKGVVAAGLVALAAAVPVSADEVILKNGAVFSGAVREEGERVVIEVDFGTVTFKRVDVRTIRRSADPIKEFEERFKAAADVKGYYDLGVWSRDRGLATRAADLFKKVVSLDPDHAGARKALGYELHEGKWLSADEVMVARGFVRHNGRWLKRETVEKILEDEKQLRVEWERAQAAERLARMQREVELAKIAVERERIELEREREKERVHFRWVARIPVPCGCSAGHAHAGAPKASAPGNGP